MGPKVFEKDVGVWDALVEVYVGPGDTSKGVMTSRLALGGNWLISDYKGNSGFDGHGMWTWDATKGKYVGVWADAGTTFLATGEGTWDADKKTMTFFYEGKGMKWRQIVETVDQDTQVFRSFVPHDAAKEMMKVTYTRRP